MTQPFTIYVVVNQVTWTNGNRIYDDGITSARKACIQNTSSPNLTATTGGGSLSTTPDLLVGTWGVIMFVFNGAVLSEVRTNLANAITGSVGVNNGAGITIGAGPSPSNFSNCEIGYLIIRDGADSTAIQDSMIRGLEAICGLTF